MTIPIPLDEYVLLWAVADDALCALCGEEADLPDIYPNVGVRDRGPLCWACFEDQPQFLQHWAKAINEIDAAARDCPPDLLPHLKAILAAAGGQVIDMRAKMIARATEQQASPR